MIFAFYNKIGKIKSSVVKVFSRINSRVCACFLIRRGLWVKLSSLFIIIYFNELYNNERNLKEMSNVDESFVKPLPNSEKIYVAGSRKDIQVPMRRITLTDTIGELAEKMTLYMCMILQVSIRIPVSKLTCVRA
ncbi:Hydroxymethylpyrimidine phosphate synthase ThiC (EC [uncultured Gammaproteobacteria bacterium]|nr:Hydroxymethylpyrimidine phosphate synthase ThiC (EC [uncultured Gammaproteobacteria bacterium]